MQWSAPNAMAMLSGYHIRRETVNKQKKFSDYRDTGNLSRHFFLLCDYWCDVDRNRDRRQAAF